MKNLMRWEFQRLFKSKSFIGVWVFITLFGLVYLIFGYNDGCKSGYEFMVGTINYISSLLELVGPIYAGICFSNAFEERCIQAEVMAGYSRIQVLISKLCNFLCSITIFILTPLILNTLITSCIFGIGEISDTFFNSMVLMPLALLLSNLAFLSICMFVSFCVHGIGVTIGVNMAVILILYGITQSAIDNESLHSILSFTSVGQSFLILINSSLSNLLLAIAVAFITIFLVLVITYIKFRNQELK